MCKNILDFVSVHYYVPKDNTTFWKDLKENRNEWLTDSLKSNLKKWSNRLPLVLEFDTKYELFTADNWIITLHGLGLLDVGKIKESYNMMLPSARAYCDQVVSSERLSEITMPHIPCKEAVELFIKNYRESTNVKH
jgi:hypothetical protein